MINHSRTVLANVLPGSLLDPLEEFVPTTFLPLEPDEIPGWLQRLRETLLGKNPDRDYLLYRVRDLLSAVYSSGNQDYLREYDKRITHGDGTDFLQYHAAWEIVQYAGAQGTVPQPLQKADPADAGARIHYRYKMVVQPSGNKIKVIRITPGPTVKDSIEWDVGVAIPLVGTGATVIKHGPVSANQAWNIDLWLTPKKSLGTLVEEIETLGSVTLAPLLVTSGGNVEPLKTFRLLWEQGQDVTRRITGITLAVIWHMEQLRRKRDGNH